MNDKSGSPARRQAYVKYSKRAAYRKRPANQARGETIVEMIVMQCIVCGIVLGALMLICLIKTPRTISLRSSIRYVLASDINSDGIEKNVSGVTCGISSSFKNIFSPEKKQPAEEINILNEESIPVFFTEEKNFRIDEDIINSIYGGGVEELNNEIKNIEAPLE